MARRKAHKSDRNTLSFGVYADAPDRQCFTGLLTVNEGAQRLSIKPATLYHWLGLSDFGALVIRGQPITIAYFQGGPAGQGRIRIEACEIERIREAMRVK